MNRMGFGKKWLVGVALLAGGCGALPEFLVDAGRDAAKEAIEQAIGKVIEEAVEQGLSGVADDFLESNGAVFPLVADGEEGSGGGLRQ